MFTLPENITCGYCDCSEFGTLKVSSKRTVTKYEIEFYLEDGENYDGARPCNYDWVKSLRWKCVDYDVTFVFCGTGRRFIKNGRLYKIEGNAFQRQLAYKSGLGYRGKPMEFKLYDEWGEPVP